MPVTTIGTTPVEFAKRDQTRVGLWVKNDSTASQIIYFDREGNIGKDGMTTSNASYVLNPGDEKVFQVADGDFQVGESWSGVADAASGKLRHAEFSQPRG